MSENENKTQDSVINIEDNKIEELIVNSIWTPEDEKILSEWADKAACYALMYDMELKIYSKKNNWYTTPVIILQTIMGAANFAQDKVPEEYRNYYSMGIGGITIISGIIATLASKYKIAEIKEAHNNATKQWDKFSRNIKLELVKSPEERISKKAMMDLSKKEYDRLVESSPEISDETISKFLNNFKNSSITKPEICNEIKPTEIFKRKEIQAPQVIIQAATVVEDPIKKRNEDLIQRFIINNGRPPSDEELLDMIELEI